MQSHAAGWSDADIECYEREGYWQRLQRLRDLEGLCAQALPVACIVPDRFLGFDHRSMAETLQARCPYLQHLIVDGDAGCHLHLLHDDEELHFLPGLQPDMKTFWTEIALGDIRVERIEGNHLSCLQPPHVQGVVAHILREQA